MTSLIDRWLQQLSYESLLCLKKTKVLYKFASVLSIWVLCSRPWQDVHHERIFLDLCFPLVLVGRRFKKNREKKNTMMFPWLFCHSPGHTLTSTHVRPHLGCRCIFLHWTACRVSPPRTDSTGGGETAMMRRKKSAQLDWNSPGVDTAAAKLYQSVKMLIQFAVEPRLCLLKLSLRLFDFCVLWLISWMSSRSTNER